MKKSITKEEANARLNLAEQIIKNFPFLKDHFHIYSSATFNEKGEEIGVLEVDIFNNNLDGSETTMQMLLSKNLDKIISKAILNQNNALRKKNKELTLKLKEHGNEVPEQRNQTASKIITSPLG